MCERLRKKGSYTYGVAIHLYIKKKKKNEKKREEKEDGLNKNVFCSELPKQADLTRN